jgi:hypothetical protein
VLWSCRGVKQSLYFVLVRSNLSKLQWTHLAFGRSSLRGGGYRRSKRGAFLSRWAQWPRGCRRRGQEQRSGSSQHGDCIGSSGVCRLFHLCKQKARLVSSIAQWGISWKRNYDHLLDVGIVTTFFFIVELAPVPLTKVPSLDCEAEGLGFQTHSKLFLSVCQDNFFLGFPSGCPYSLFLGCYAHQPNHQRWVQTLIVMSCHVTEVAAF